MNMPQQWRSGRFLLACGLALLLATAMMSRALAAAGDLDSTFSADGKQTVDFVEGGDVAYAVAVGSDGKIVVAGSAPGAGASDFALARLTANGDLDTSFGAAGKVLTDVNSSTDEARAVFILGNGKVVVAGASSEAFAVVRYDANGTLDTSFGGGDGIATLPVDGSASVRGAAMGADGKIVVVGSSNTNFALVRFTADGAPDTTFDGDGYSSTDFGGSADEATAVVIDGSKILVGGSTDAGGSTKFALARFLNNGALDTTFGLSGHVTTDFGDGNARLNGLLIQADGKIVAAGQTLTSATDFDFALARYTSAGSLDNTFSGDGKQTTDFNGNTDLAYALLYNESSGKLIAAGQAYGEAIQGDNISSTANKVDGATQSNNFALAAYNANGSLDSTFGSGGKVTTDFDFSSNDGINALALAPGGKLVAAGFRQIADADTSDFALARYSGFAPGTTPTRTPTNTPTATPTALPVSFTDLHPDNPFYAPVTYLVGQGVISGYNSSPPCPVGQTPCFLPYSNATRAQLTKIIVVALDWTINTSGGPHFSDVLPTNGLYPFIETAFNRGIISGYVDHPPISLPCFPNASPCFAPNNFVTRGQMTKIVVLALGWPLLNPTTPTFTDVGTSYIFYQSIETAVSHGIVSGYADHTFRPVNFVTRGQMAKIVYLAITAPADAAINSRK